MIQFAVRSGGGEFVDRWPYAEWADRGFTPAVVDSLQTISITDPDCISPYFLDCLGNYQLSPLRQFSIGTSDYSERVTRWPSLKRSSEELLFGRVTIPLDNVDGHFNNFYNQLYTIPNTCTLKIGISGSDANITAYGDMETDLGWANWQEWGNTQQSSIYFHSGRFSRLFDCTSAQNGIVYGPKWHTDTGRYYYVDLWVYPESSTTIGIALQQGDNSAAAHDSSHLIELGIWNNIIFSYQESNGGNFAYINIYANSGDGRYYVDDVQIHAPSEMLTVYTGFLKSIRYRQKQCQLTLRDRLFDLADRKIGESNSTVVFSETIPSDIAWTICTCYGGLSSLESNNNPDLDYGAFQQWAAVMSADSLQMNARYSGLKISEALINLAKMTDSGIYVQGDGRIAFHMYKEVDSLDLVLTHNNMVEFPIIDVEADQITNRIWVHADYQPTSDYYTISVFDIDSVSVNSFYLHETIYQDKTIWHINSINAHVLGQRKLLRYKYPPRRFKLSTSFFGLQKDIGNTLRFVDDFYGITSTDGWRIVEHEINMADGKVIFDAAEAAVFNAFYLDISSLDSEDLLA